MERMLVVAAIGVAAVMAGVVIAYLFWRHYWFWRNPARRIPPGDNFVSPADGTVVYVHRAAPSEPVVAYKEGKAASINDVAKEDLGLPKIHIGVFMSPFGVHYNRVPLAGVVEYTRQYPAVGKNLHMTSMHWRCLLRWMPISGNSPHIVQNNRAVTRFSGFFRGDRLCYYVVQIGGGSVHGIDVYCGVGQTVEKGQVFGMIRVGSQVDLIVPDLPGLTVRVKPGDRVVAGETILVE